MNDMQFDNSSNEFGTPVQEKPGTDITGKLIKWGLVSTRQEAEYVLMAIGIIALVGSFFMYRSLSGGSDVPTTPNYGTVQQL